jgi:hypothetical protein
MVMRDSHGATPLGTRTARIVTPKTWEKCRLERLEIACLLFFYDF